MKSKRAQFQLSLAQYEQERERESCGLTDPPLELRVDISEQHEGRDTPRLSTAITPHHIRYHITPHRITLTEPLHRIQTSASKDRDTDFQFGA